MRTIKCMLLTALLSLALSLPADLSACSRVVYKGSEGLILTGRTMDFAIDIPANLWVFPRGMERQGQVGPNSIAWTSRYGSLVASSWDIGVPDGINEEGLVANMLWLSQSVYPDFEKDGDKKGLTIAAWAQYALDNFATVAEAVEELRKEEFVIVSEFIPGTDKFTTVHLSLSDAGGDSAIFEYINGELVIHHDPSYQVMTNDPLFEEQRAIMKYWKRIPGTVFLPGTNNPSDRFVRASYYIDAIPKTDDPDLAVASVFSVIRNVSVPYGISTEDAPHISSTRWRVVADHHRLLYFFENVLTPNVFWVDLKKTDMSPGAPVLKLTLDGDEVYAGEASAYFEEAEPFEFQGL